MDADSDLVENIKACRTCGIHYVTPSKHQLKHLFQSPSEHSEIMLIRLELSKWNIEVMENDGFPQYVCNTCIHKFEQVFALRATCISAQNEFRKFYAVPNGSFPNAKIKTELPDPDEQQPVCDFVYVDDLSDSEYDGATPFNFPHIPIKEEVIEAATIPMEETVQATNIVESASRVVIQSGPSPSHIPEHLSNNESVDPIQSSVAAQCAVEKFECNICQHYSCNQEEHTQHMQQVHEIYDFECHICGKEFKNSTSARFKFHMKWHTLNKNLKCNLCSYICSSKNALREHKRTNHRKLNCKICRKVVLAKKMKSHLRQHELMVSKYSCEYCAEAFPTEDKREDHIWQIHANEDSTVLSNSLSTFETTCAQVINESPFKMTHADILYQEPQEDTLYKFVCAHCEQRFMEQIDLEIHVNEEHRIVSAAFIENAHITETAEMAGNEDVNDHANFKVFEEYDNVNEVHVPVENDAPHLPRDFMLPSTSSDFVTQIENVQSAETGAASDESFDEEHHVKETEHDTNSNFSSYVASDLNAFACAKCSQTFVSIEQLRQHYDQHLIIDQQEKLLNTTAIKPIFKCNLCEKSFDLKFILNRHVKKHKHAPL